MSTMTTDATFRDRLRRHAREIGGVPALIGHDATVRYGDLPDIVASMAATLRRMGVGPGDVVVLTARREVQHVIAMLALIDLGAAQLALPSRDPPSLRAGLAKRVRASTVLADRPEDAIEGLAWVDLGAAFAASRPHAHDESDRAVDPAAVAIYLTGSGTTGEPKIVAYAQRDLIAQANVLDTHAGQCVLRPAHVEFNNSKRRRLYALWQGATSVFADGSNEPVRGLCVRHRVTWLELSPLHAADLVASCGTEGPLPDHVSIRVGGGRASVSLRRAILEAATPRLYVSYGATEVPIVSIATPGMHDDTEPLGPPAPGVTVDIRLADGTPAGPDEIGEARIRAPGMATRYVGDDEATARHFRDGWFVPGDMMSRRGDGLLCIHGRADDMMLLDSINIFPAEIERALELHPAVSTAAAFPVASQLHGQIPAAAVELREGASCTPAELLAFARSRLGIRAPRRIEIVASLPRNPQGKVLKRELARRLEANRG